MALVDIIKIDDEYFIIENSKLMVKALNSVERRFSVYLQDIDEMVALPIVELSKKGYMTNMSCSSHNYHRFDMCYEWEPEHTEAVFRYHNKDDDEYYLLNKCEYGKKSYLISFSEDYFFDKEIPRGWEYSHHSDETGEYYRLKKDLEADDNTEIFDVVLAQAKAGKELMEWIRKLPSIK